MFESALKDSGFKKPSFKKGKTVSRQELYKFNWNVTINLRYMNAEFFR